jgi:hypothetical protein
MIILKNSGLHPLPADFSPAFPARVTSNVPLPQNGLEKFSGCSNDDRKTMCGPGPLPGTAASHLTGLAQAPSEAGQR